MGKIAPFDFSASAWHFTYRMTLHQSEASAAL